MDKEKELPKRKSTRLKNFDYSCTGAYFVTICTRDRTPILSEIVKTNLAATDETIKFEVGEGLAPPEFMVQLKPCGEIANEQLQLIETRFPSVIRCVLNGEFGAVCTRKANCLPCTAFLGSFSHIAWK